jgi:hypothetical protein
MSLLAAENLMHEQVTLITYATKPYYHQQRLLAASARRVGISKHALWTDSRLKQTEFHRNNQEILNSPRGAGYWAWKPYLIKVELEAASSGDFVFYYDVGHARWPHRVTESLVSILKWCEVENGGLFPGIYVPENGRNARWTKRECFVQMNCDNPTYWNHPQIQATFSIWQKNPESIRIVDEWLKWCITPGVITDAVSSSSVENFPDFVDHRHDQSILTNILIRNGIRCYGRPDVPIVETKDIRASKDINLVANVVAGNFQRVGALLFRRALMGFFRKVIWKIREVLPSRQPT